MIALTHLRSGEYPPDDEDFVLVSIALNGKAQVTARFGETGFRSEAVFEHTSDAAAAKGIRIAKRWAKDLGLGLIYVEHETPETPNA